MSDATGSVGSLSERERALKSTHEECVPDLLRYVAKLLGGDRYQAEDIVQETLLRCWEKRLPEGQQSIRPWLFRVAKNLVIDEYRKRSARPREVESVDIFASTPSEDNNLDRALSEVIVHEAIKHLTEAHKEVLYEIFYMGRTIKEAAESLNIPVGTVKSRLYYALRAVKSELQRKIPSTPS